MSGSLKASMKMQVNSLVWALFWLGSFLTLELLALFFGPTGMTGHHLVPWTTLSEYVWSIEFIKPWGSLMTVGVLLFFSGLTAHFVAKWTP